MHTPPEPLKWWWQCSQCGEVYSAQTGWELELIIEYHNADKAHDEQGG